MPQLKTTPQNNWTMTVWDAERQEYSPLRRLDNTPNVNRIIEALNVSRIKITLDDTNVIIIDKGKNVDTYV